MTDDDHRTATMETLSRGMGRIEARLDGLPCAEHRDDIGKAFVAIRNGKADRDKAAGRREAMAGMLKVAGVCIAACAALAGAIALLIQR